MAADAARRNRAATELVVLDRIFRRGKLALAVPRNDDRFRLLTGGHRTAMPRHRTLQATLDWSYELLTEAERMVLRRLAIFAGSFTLQAAEQIAADDKVSVSEVVDCVANLIEKSLVIGGVIDTTVRYRLLETTRRHQLRARGNPRDHHAQHTGPGDPRLGPTPPATSTCRNPPAP